MKQQAIYFIETSKGEILYKQDTFWSRGKDVQYAKVHYDTDDDKERFFSSLCTSLKPYDVLLHQEFIKTTQDRYTNSRYGYQVVNSNKNINYIKDDIVNYSLQDPIYLKIITSIEDDYTINSTDFTPYDRDSKLNQLGI